MSDLIAATAMVFWGATGATIVDTGQTPHVATVHCTNELTYGDSRNEGTLSLGDLSVTVVVSHQPGDMPDKFEIIVPEGYIAIPPVLWVNEKDVGEIRIFKVGDTPFG